MILALFAARVQAGGYVVVIPQGGSPYASEGIPASVSLEVTDAPITSTEGLMTKGDVIAVHSVRAHDTVVLDAPVQGKVRVVPAGTVLVRVSYGRDSAAWCDISIFTHFRFSDDFDCLTAPTSSVFTGLTIGHSITKLQGFSSSGIESGTVLSIHAPFHKIEPDAAYSARLGLRFCDGDGVKGPQRFEALVTPLGGPDTWRFAGQCSLGVWPNPEDKSHVEVDGMHLVVEAAAGGAYHYRVTDRLPIGPIPRLIPGGSVRPRSGVNPEGPPIDPLIALDTDRTLVLVDTAPKVSDGATSVGSTFANVRVRHGITGVLENSIDHAMLWKSDSGLQAGQPVFGIRMDTGALVWCAPRIKAGATQHETVCLMPSVPVQWLPRCEPAFLPSEIRNCGSWNSSSSSPTVTRKPVSFPLMTISLALGEIRTPNRPGAPLRVSIDWYVDWGMGAQKYRSTFLDMPDQGRELDFMGQKIWLKAVPATNQVLVENRGAGLTTPSIVRDKKHQ